MKIGALEGIRTPDPRNRNPVLYPAELRTHRVLSSEHYSFFQELVDSLCSTHKCFFANALPEPDFK